MDCDSNEEPLELDYEFSDPEEAECVLNCNGSVIHLERGSESLTPLQNSSKEDSENISCQKKPSKNITYEATFELPELKVTESVPLTPLFNAEKNVISNSKPSLDNFSFHKNHSTRSRVEQSVPVSGLAQPFRSSLAIENVCPIFEVNAECKPKNIRKKTNLRSCELNVSSALKCLQDISEKTCSSSDTISLNDFKEIALKNTKETSKKLQDIAITFGSFTKYESSKTTEKEKKLINNLDRMDIPIKKNVQTNFDKSTVGNLQVKKVKKKLLFNKFRQVKSSKILEKPCYFKLKTVSKKAANSDNISPDLLTAKRLQFVRATIDKVVCESYNSVKISTPKNKIKASHQKHNSACSLVGCAKTTVDVNKTHKVPQQCYSPALPVTQQTKDSVSLQFKCHASEQLSDGSCVKQHLQKIPSEKCLLITHSSEAPAASQQQDCITHQGLPLVGTSASNNQSKLMKAEHSHSVLPGPRSKRVFKEFSQLFHNETTATESLFVAQEKSKRLFESCSNHSIKRNSVMSVINCEGKVADSHLDSVGTQSVPKEHLGCAEHKLNLSSEAVLSASIPSYFEQRDKFGMLQRVFFQLTSPVQHVLPHVYVKHSNVIKDAITNSCSASCESKRADDLFLFYEPSGVVKPFILLNPYYRGHPHSDLCRMQVKEKTVNILVNTMVINRNSFPNGESVFLIENDQAIMLVYGIIPCQMNPSVISSIFPKLIIEKSFHNSNLIENLSSTPFKFFKICCSSFIMDSRIISAKLMLQATLRNASHSHRNVALQPLVNIGPNVDVVSRDLSAKAGTLLTKVSSEYRSADNCEGFENSGSPSKKILTKLSDKIQCTSETQSLASDDFTSNTFKKKRKIVNSDRSDRFLFQHTNHGYALPQTCNSVFDLPNKLFPVAKDCHEYRDTQLDRDRTTEKNKRMITPTVDIPEKNVPVLLKVDVCGDITKASDKFTGRATAYDEIKLQNATVKKFGNGNNSKCEVISITSQNGLENVNQQEAEVSLTKCITSHEGTYKTYFKSKHEYLKPIVTSSKKRSIDASYPCISQKESTIGLNSILSIDSSKDNVSLSSLPQQFLSTSSISNSSQTALVSAQLLPSNVSRPPASVNVVSSALQPCISLPEPTPSFSGLVLCTQKLRREANVRSEVIQPEYQEQSLHPTCNEMQTSERPHQQQPSQYQDSGYLNNNSSTAYMENMCHPKLPVQHIASEPTTLHEQQRTYYEQIQKHDRLHNIETFQRNGDPLRLLPGYGAHIAKDQHFINTSVSKLSPVTMEHHLCMVCDICLTGTVSNFRMHVNSKKHLYSSITQLRAMSDMLYKIKGFHLAPVDVAEASRNMEVVHEEVEEVEETDILPCKSDAASCVSSSSDRDNCEDSLLVSKRQVKARSCNVSKTPWEDRNRSVESSSKSRSVAPSRVVVRQHTYWYQMSVVNAIMKDDDTRDVAGETVSSQGSTTTYELKYNSEQSSMAGELLPQHSNEQSNPTTTVAATNVTVIVPSSYVASSHVHQTSIINKSINVNVPSTQVTPSHNPLPGVGRISVALSSSSSSPSGRATDGWRNLCRQSRGRLPVQARLGRRCSAISRGSSLNPFRFQSLSRKNFNAGIKSRMVSVLPVTPNYAAGVKSRLGKRKKPVAANIENMILTSRTSNYSLADKLKFSNKSFNTNRNCDNSGYSENKPQITGRGDFADNNLRGMVDVSSASNNSSVNSSSFTDRASLSCVSDVSVDSGFGMICRVTDKLGRPARSPTRILNYDFLRAPPSPYYPHPLIKTPEELYGETEAHSVRDTRHRFDQRSDPNIVEQNNSRKLNCGINGDYSTGVNNKIVNDSICDIKTMREQRRSYIIGNPTIAIPVRPLPPTKLSPDDNSCSPELLDLDCHVLKRKHISLDKKEYKRKKTEYVDLDKPLTNFVGYFDKERGSYCMLNTMQSKKDKGTCTDGTVVAVNAYTPSALTNKVDTPLSLNDNYDDSYSCMLNAVINMVSVPNSTTVCQPRRADHSLATAQELTVTADLTENSGTSGQFSDIESLMRDDLTFDVNDNYIESTDRYAVPASQGLTVSLMNADAIGTDANNCGTVTANLTYAHFGQNEEFRDRDCTATQHINSGESHKSHQLVPVDSMHESFAPTDGHTSCPQKGNCDIANNELLAHTNDDYTTWINENLFNNVYPNLCSANSQPDDFIIANQGVSNRTDQLDEIDLQFSIESDDLYVIDQTDNHRKDSAHTQGIINNTRSTSGSFGYGMNVDRTVAATRAGIDTDDSSIKLEPACSDMESCLVAGPEPVTPMDYDSALDGLSVPQLVLSFEESQDAEDCFNDDQTVLLHMSDERNEQEHLFNESNRKDTRCKENDAPGMREADKVLVNATGCNDVTEVNRGETCSAGESYNDLDDRVEMRTEQAKYFDIDKNDGKQFESGVVQSHGYNIAQRQIDQASERANKKPLDSNCEVYNSYFEEMLSIDFDASAPLNVSSNEYNSVASSKACPVLSSCDSESQLNTPNISMDNVLSNDEREHSFSNSVCNAKPVTEKEQEHEHCDVRSSSVIVTAPAVVCNPHALVSEEQNLQVVLGNGSAASGSSAQIPIADVTSGSTLTYDSEDSGSDSESSSSVQHTIYASNQSIESLNEGNVNGSINDIESPDTSANKIGDLPDSMNKIDSPGEHVQNHNQDCEEKYVNKWTKNNITSVVKDVNMSRFNENSLENRSNLTSDGNSDNNTSNIEDTEVSHKLNNKDNSDILQKYIAEQNYLKSSIIREVAEHDLTVTYPSSIAALDSSGGRVTPVRLTCAQDWEVCSTSGQACVADHSSAFVLDLSEDGTHGERVSDQFKSQEVIVRNAYNSSQLTTATRHHDIPAEKNFSAKMTACPPETEPFDLPIRRECDVFGSSVNLKISVIEQLIKNININSNRITEAPPLKNVSDKRAVCDGLISREYFDPSLTSSPKTSRRPLGFSAPSTNELSPTLLSGKSARKHGRKNYDSVQEVTGTKEMQYTAEHVSECRLPSERPALNNLSDRTALKNPSTPAPSQNLHATGTVRALRRPRLFGIKALAAVEDGASVFSNVLKCSEHKDSFGTNRHERALCDKVAFKEPSMPTTSSFAIERSNSTTGSSCLQFHSTIPSTVAPAADSCSMPGVMTDLAFNKDFSSLSLATTDNNCAKVSRKRDAVIDVHDNICNGENNVTTLTRPSVIQTFTQSVAADDSISNTVDRNPGSILPISVISSQQVVTIVAGEGIPADVSPDRVQDNRCAFSAGATNVHLGDVSMDSTCEVSADNASKTYFDVIAGTSNTTSLNFSAQSTKSSESLVSSDSISAVQQLGSNLKKRLSSCIYTSHEETCAKRMTVASLLDRSAVELTAPKSSYLNSNSAESQSQVENHKCAVIDRTEVVSGRSGHSIGSEGFIDLTGEEDMEVFNEKDSVYPEVINKPPFDKNEDEDDQCNISFCVKDDEIISLLDDGDGDIEIMSQSKQEKTALAENKSRKSVICCTRYFVPVSSNTECMARYREEPFAESERNCSDMRLSEKSNTSHSRGQIYYSQASLCTESNASYCSKSDIFRERQIAVYGKSRQNWSSTGMLPISRDQRAKYSSRNHPAGSFNFLQSRLNSTTSFGNCSGHQQMSHSGFDSAEVASPSPQYCPTLPNLSKLERSQTSSGFGSASKEPIKYSFPRLAAKFTFPSPQSPPKVNVCSLPPSDPRYFSNQELRDPRLHKVKDSLPSSRLSEYPPHKYGCFRATEELPSSGLKAIQMSVDCRAGDLLLPPFAAGISNTNKGIINLHDMQLEQAVAGSSVKSALSFTVQCPPAPHKTLREDAGERKNAVFATSRQNAKKLAVSQSNSVFSCTRPSTGDLQKPTPSFSYSKSTALQMPSRLVLSPANPLNFVSPIRSPDTFGSPKTSSNLCTSHSAHQKDFNREFQDMWDEFMLTGQKRADQSKLSTSRKQFSPAHPK